MNPIVLGVGALAAGGYIAYRWLKGLGKGAAAAADWAISDTEAGRNIQLAYKLSGDFADAIVQTAARLGMHPYDMANVMNFESKFNPQAVNKSSGATGLIQFMPRTAAALGTSTNALYAMDWKGQMPYVEKYFRMVRDGEWSGGKGPLNSTQAVFMAVFVPTMRYVDPNTKLTGNVAGYDKSVNLGIDSPAQYIEWAMKNAKLDGSTVKRK